MSQDFTWGAGLLVIAVLLAWPKLPAPVRRVPGPLVAVVSMTALAQILARDVRRVRPRLAIARIIEDQHALGMRPRRRGGEEQRQPLSVHRGHVPGRLGEKPLQALPRGRLPGRPHRTTDTISPCPTP